MATLNEAFRLMTGSLYALSGRRTQVRGVIAWEQLVTYAESCAAGCNRSAEMPGAPFQVRFHGDWKELCGAIIAALRGHASDAHVLHCEKGEAARIAGTERDQYANDAAAHAAERDRQLAWAAGAPDERLRGACEAAADAAEAARAEADRLAREAGERHLAAAEAADLAMTWRVASIQAAGAGDLLVMSEDAEVAPLIIAYANAGGQVAGDKTYHQGGAAA